MSFKPWRAELHLGVVLGMSLALFVSCGGGGSHIPTSTPSPPVANSLAAVVNAGPANNSVNTIYVSVTVCQPSTSQCQTIPNIEVDTGSEGLRLLSSAVTVSLPAVNDSSGNPLQECVSFADGSFVWGPVVTADIQMAGEIATAVPTHIISTTPAFPAPSNCTSGGGPDLNTLTALDANGIIGLGVFEQDCGFACTAASTSVPPMYYLCPNSVCQVVSVALSTQLQNPVPLFPQDNNGLLISLPSVGATGAATDTGSLIFGVATQSDNALGSAQIYTTDANGNFTTTYLNVPYNMSFLDTGSNGIFFLDTALTSLPVCKDNSGFYCPTATASFTATNTGANGTSAAVSFSIANADSLFQTTTNNAFNNLGGPNPGAFDWGLPFFIGRNVFIGIENQAGPNNSVGPYWAY